MISQNIPLLQEAQQGELRRLLHLEGEDVAHFRNDGDGRAALAGDLLALRDRDDLEREIRPVRGEGGAQVVAARLDQHDVEIGRHHRFGDDAQSRGVDFVQRIEHDDRSEPGLLVRATQADQRFDDLRARYARTGEKRRARAARLRR